MAGGQALNRIEAELIALAEAADAEHPICPHEIRIIARKINAQAEIADLDLGEPA